MTKKYLEKLESVARRVCSARSAGKLGGTCWNSEGTVRRKQPWTMGEGSGFNLLCFGPDKVTSRGLRPDEEELSNVSSSEELEERRRQKERKAAAKKAMRAYQNWSKNRLDGYRIFLIPYPKKKWENIVQNAGGLPHGVDVAHSDFGDLLLVPVFESHHVSKQLKPTHGRRQDGIEKMLDRQGWEYWIEQDLMTELQRVFGYVQWKSPITLFELKDFNIKLG